MAEGYKLQVKGDRTISTTAPTKEALVAMLLDQLEELEPGSVLKLTITKQCK